ncbi:MAG: response regulator [Bdellovibrionota bacterium]
MPQTLNSIKILLVDDDDLLRSVLKTALTGAGYLVAEAQNGKAAEQIFALEDFQLVITDIKMPGINGIELLHHIKRTKPVPVVLMTGFSEILETQEAYELGADEFISKPFKKEELLRVVDKWLRDGSSQVEARNLDDDFCRLSIDDFILGHGVRCDIYVRLSEVKYVKIAHGGANIPLEITKALKARGVRYLHVVKEDFRNYVGFTVALSKAVKGSTKIGKEKKLNLLKHTGEVILEHLSSSGIDEESFEDAKAVMESTVAVLADDTDMLELLSVLNSHADFIYAHSVGVAFYAILLAQKLEWRSTTNRFKIAMAGLLHDIGKKEIDRGILMKPRSELSEAEMKVFESHTTRGAEILARVSAIPSDVLQICAQHHENCLGTGYPQHIRKAQIHPLARLISVANEFCNLAIKNPWSPGMLPLQAIARMKILFRGTLDDTFVDALEQLFVRK